MAWFRCTGGNGSGQTAPAVSLKYSNGTTGTSSFVIDESGYYLLTVVYSLNGSGTISIPQGRTASYSGDVLVNNNKGMKIVVAELQSGDTVSLGTTVSNWIANTKAVIKIPFLVSSLVDSSTASDTDIVYALSAGSGDVLCLATAWARQIRSDYIYDDSDIVDDMIAGMTDTNVIIRAFVCDASVFPTIRMRGYDGGGVAVAVMQ